MLLFAAGALGAQPVAAAPGDFSPEVEVAPMRVAPLSESLRGTTWTPIFEEGFESGFGAWNVLDSAGAGAEWGISTCWSASGARSAGCAFGGTFGISCGQSYFNDMRTWMIHGPFSLDDADALDARLEYELNFNTEDTYDSLYVGVSTNGTNFLGEYRDADYVGPDALTLAAQLGEPQVWIGFLFLSDFSESVPNGAQVDDVRVLVEREDVPSGSNVLSLTDASGAAATNVDVTLAVANENALQGIQADLTFDSQVARLVSIATTARGTGFTAAAETVQNGRARFVLHSPGTFTLAPGTGAIATLRFALVGELGTSSPIGWDDILLADPEARAVTGTGTGATLSVSGEAAPQVQVVAWKNPGQPRSVQIVTRVRFGSGNPPTVTAGGTPVAMEAVGDGVYRGMRLVAAGTSSLAVVATDSNGVGSGTGTTDVTFGGRGR